jgi:hypothetical protein
MIEVSVNESPTCITEVGLRDKHQQLVKVSLKLKLRKQLI